MRNSKFAITAVLLVGLTLIIPASSAAESAKTRKAS